MDGGAAHRAENTQKRQKPQRRGRKILFAVLCLAVAAGLVTAGTLYWLNARQFQSTDDAFIDGHITQVAPQVGGQVLRLEVTDNQTVTAGQVLIEIDQRDLQLRLDQAMAQQAQARAQLDHARAQVDLQRASIDQAEAQVRVTQAELGQAQADLSRFRTVDPKAIARQQLDNAGAAARSAQARLDANRYAVTAARAQLAGLEASVANMAAGLRSADVAERNAELQLSYTRVAAPGAGRVTRRTVERGNTVSAGQSLLSIVAPGMWVTANFKETQLARMRAGQAVEIRVDAVPDRVFHGRIDSVQAGSGQAFSTLPAENATGNFVKVIQRVPVKITLDDAGDSLLAPGLSVTPSVRVR